MATLVTVLPFLALGALGAAHCAGMCGGFALAVSAASPAGRGRALRRQLAYVLGKALTYALLGLLAARAGHLLVAGGAEIADPGPEGRAAALDGFRRALAWVAGGAMVLLGLSAAGLFAPLAPLAPLAARAGASRPASGARRVLAGVRALPGSAGAFGTGLLTGLLPCGLSWGALALATTVTPLSAALGLFAFGLATAPVLIAVGLGWHGLSVRFRRFALAAAGPLLIVFGVLTAMRGGPPGSGELTHRILPDCCTQHAAQSPPSSTASNESK